MKKELWHRLGSGRAFPICDAKSHTQACLSPGPLYRTIVCVTLCLGRLCMVNWDPWDLCQLESWHILYWSWQLSPITLIIHKHCLLCVCFVLFCFLYKFCFILGLQTLAEGGGSGLCVPYLHTWVTWLSQHSCLRSCMFLTKAPKLLLLMVYTFAIWEDQQTETRSRDC